MITGIRYTMTISSISELKLVLLKSSEANFLLPGFSELLLVVQKKYKTLSDFIFIPCNA
jgi:hypothetical protein